MKGIHCSSVAVHDVCRQLAHFLFDPSSSQHKGILKICTADTVGNPFPLVISGMRYGRFRKKSHCTYSFLSHSHFNSAQLNPGISFGRSLSYMIGGVVVNHCDMHLRRVSFFTQFTDILCSRVQMFVIATYSTHLFPGVWCMVFGCLHHGCLDVSHSHLQWGRNWM